MPNLYGSIISSIALGLIGGPGLVAGASIGQNHILFDQASRNCGKDIYGKNLANPTGIILSSINMLNSMHLSNFAETINEAVGNVYSQGIRTADVGGKCTTQDFVKRICDEIVKIDK